MALWSLISLEALPLNKQEYTVVLKQDQPEGQIIFLISSRMKGITIPFQEFKRC